MAYKNIISGIYTIRSIIDNKIYVGKAVNVNERLNSHKSDLRNNRHVNCHLQNAFNLRGESNFEFDLLMDCEREYLCSWENYWCNMLNTHNDRFGYNLYPTTPNGTSKLTEKSVEKRTKTRRENAEKRGYWVSEEHKERVRKEKKGKPVHPNMLLNRIKKMSKAVVKMDLEGNEIKTYNSMNEAARENNLFVQGISLACSGKVKTCGGYMWKKIFI